MPTFEEWAGTPGRLQIFLVETSARRVADGAVIPLYFADYPPDNLSRFYLPCIKEMPRLTRQGNDTLSPNHVPTWGDLTLWVEMDYRPDGGNAITWRELLSPAYTFVGQPLVLKVGGEEFAEGDYYTLFTGHVGGVSWDEGDGTATLRLYDKGQDLERKIPDFELGESALVDKDSWDQLVPLPLGIVKNYSPLLIRAVGANAYLYALAGAVIGALDAVYYSAVPANPATYVFTQKDVSPANKDAQGAAVLLTSGPYTGAAVQREWLIQIDSITALNSQGDSGPEVGLATFRWSVDGGITWLGSGILTWLLAYDSATLGKNPAVGNATVVISGDYTGDAKLVYYLKVVTGGYIGGTPAPQFVWSDDGGITWSAPVDILDNDPITLNRGLSAAFAGTSGHYVPAQTWTPIASAPGRMYCLVSSPADNVAIEITTGGSPGLGAMFRWDAGGGWSAPQAVESALGIWAGGSGYVVGDVLEFVQAGASGMQAWVETVDGAGGVTGIRIKERGMNYTVADGLQTTTNGGGTGCMVNIKAVDATGALDIRPIELFAGHWIGFTEGGLMAQDQYDAGDSGYSFAAYVYPFVVNDLWGFSFKEIPIPLADGVSIQFYTQAGQDFALYDEWRFRLISTVLCLGVADTTDITADVRGMIDPVTLAAVDTAATIIRAIIAVWAGWDPDAEFVGALMTAFDAAIPYQMGLLLDSPTAITEIIDTLLTGVPAIYGLTLDGEFYLKELVNPAGSPALSLTGMEYFPSRTGEKDGTNFYRRVYFHYDRNWSPNRNAAGVTQERLQWLCRDWHQISRQNRDLANSVEASELGPLDTCLISREDAGLLAQKLIDLYGVRRETQEVETKIQAFRRNIGDTVAVDGELFTLLGLELDMYDRSILTVWR